MQETRETIIDVARGEKEGDILLKNAKIVNVFTGEIEENHLVMVGDTIAGIGNYEIAKTVVDLDGQYLIPGFVDAHIHIESSHLIPSSFGQSVLEKGTTAVIADPHEIANVLGKEGIDFMVADAKKAPMDIFYMVPSAVPSTAMETSGAVLDSKDVAQILSEYPNVIGLGEVMNSPGVLFKDPDVLDKLDAAADKILDGHFPMGKGKDLNAYAAMGMNSDHESVSYEEAKEKLSRGIMIHIREGSSAKNLERILPLIEDKNSRYFCFCADDISAYDMEEGGDILHIVKKAVKIGLDPVTAVTIATINPCLHYGLKRRGALAPGYLGDLVVVKDLMNFEITAVYKNGKAFQRKDYTEPVSLGKIKVPQHGALSFPKPAEEKFARVIKVSPTELITEETIVPVADLANRPDIAKLLVMERHGKNGNMGWGLVEGFGDISCTMAQTIAHDSHNLLVLGKKEKDMAFAIKSLVKQGGGAIVTRGEEVLASLPLSIGGLMSWESGKEVAKKEGALVGIWEECGFLVPSPLMTLSFLALPVIPKLKLTDMGLFDGEAFGFTSLYF